MKFFRIEDSFAVANRWFLSDPKVNGDELDSRLFTQCREYCDGSVLDVSIEKGENPLDFTFGPFDVPIVKRCIGELIEDIAPTDVQRIPIRIGKLDGYEILNVLRLTDGIDEERSEIRRWQEKDGWLEKVGEYVAIGDLVLKKKSVSRFKIFRLENWELPLVVCETIERRLRERGTSGITFRELKLG